MKLLFYTKTFIALTVAIAAAAGTVSQAQEQPIPPPSTDSAMPSDIAPGSPLSEVIKMIQAGIDPGTVKAYIQNSQNSFNLDADKIIYLKDLGAPSDVIDAMMDRDKALYASTVTPPPAPAPAPPPVDTSVPDTSIPDTAPPPTEVTVNYFNDTLTPYGTWVDVDGYGRCWRPTVVVYDTGWSPYCDRGHWVYTDYGWYWDSDYSWGVTFHYGRWFRNPRFGWCWYPDTVWAPSWVAWRSGGDYCGWAPLPPFAVFRPGAGFFYRGVSVGVNFDFGLAADCFVFVSPDHFCDRHPRSFCADREHAIQAFHHTTIVNNYAVNNTTIINRGFGPDRIASATHRPIEPIHVSTLPNAGRQGWRGDGWERTTQHPTGNDHIPGHRAAAGGAGSGVAGQNGQFRHGPETHNPGNTVTTGHRGSPVQAAQGSQPGGHQTDYTRPQGQYSQPTGGAGRGQPQTYTRDPQPPQQPSRQFNSPAGQNPSAPQYQWQQPQQPQQKPRQANTFGEPNRTVPQNQWQQPPQVQQQPRQYNYTYSEPNRGVPQNQNQWQQNRGFGTPATEGAQQHGAAQLQQRPYVPPEQPRQQEYQNPAPSQAHNYSPPPSSQGAPQAQPQQHSSGNGYGGGANNGNYGSNKQNR